MLKSVFSLKEADFEKLNVRFFGTDQSGDRVELLVELREMAPRRSSASLAV